MRSETGVDVLVVGAGIIGSAAAWQLARRGHSVALCEQFALGHVHGSSHGRSRIFRLAYDAVDYVRLAQRSLDGWKDLEQEADQQLLWNTGGLDIGAHESLDPIAAALAAGGATFDWLSPSDSLVAGFKLPPDWVALHQADAGVLRAKSCLNAFQERARLAGARVPPETRVIGLVDHGTSVGVETDNGAFEAQSVIVATAGWTPILLGPLGLAPPIRVTREHVAYYRARATIQFVPFIWHPGDGKVEQYGLPGMKEGFVKLGEHGSGPEVAPGSTGMPDAGRVEEISEFVRSHVPGLIDEPHMVETCLYASTPDDDFVIERAGAIVTGVGFGGHGFKFAPVIGEMLADLVEGREIACASRFSHKRFQDAPKAVSNAG